VRLKLGQGVAGWVAMTGQPLNVPDAYRDPRFFQGVDEASGFVTQSILCVPLTADGKVIGVLEAVNKHQGQFTAADERLLSALSSSAAIAIHKAHLHQNVVDEKRRMDAIIASMGEGLMTIAVDGRITTINPTLLGMIGTAPGEIPVGLDCRSVIGTEPAVLTEMLEEMAAHAGDRQAYQAPCDILRADGSRLPVLVSGGATTGPDGLASEIVVVFSDVCQLREIERMKDDFVANVTHELRTPLATILLYARLLRSGRTKGDPEREARYLGIIEQQSDQLQKLVRKILDLARMEATRSRSPHLPFRLQTLCAEVLPPLVNLAQAKGLTVQVRIPEHLPAISGDAEAMRLVLANLMDNAIKFTPQGKISVSARRRGDTVQLTVSDEGIGINPESVPHLFQRFYRTQTAVERGIGGTGLGLALVKEAVETLGGSIALRSQAGKGTVLAVRLPVCSSPESSD
jgi:two-component system phosphate regulon sensor histidine kinase PhoR